MRFVSGLLGGADVRNDEAGEGVVEAVMEVERKFGGFGQDLPKALEVLGCGSEGQMRGVCRRVVVIGVHGWFPGTIVRTVLGEVSFFFWFLLNVKFLIKEGCSRRERARSLRR